MLKGLGKAKRILGYSLDDPLSWRTRTGQAVVPIAKALFDLAEKMLVVAAVSVAARLTGSEDAAYFGAVLAAFFGLYVFFQIDHFLALAFARMQWHGLAAFFSYFAVATAGGFASMLLLVPWVMRVADSVVEATL